MLCLGKVLQHPESNKAWKNRVAGARAERSYRDYDAINGEPTEFEWNIFPGFTTLQLCDKICDLLSDLGKTTETFTGRILFMSMFNDISCDRNDNKDECLKNANYVKTFAGRFGIGQRSFIGPGSEKKWYSSENSPQGAWDNIAEEMLLEFAESAHPIFRATTPLSRGPLKSKGRGKLSIHFTADQDTVDTIYRIILSVNQLSVYGAVAAFCEEFEDHQDRTGQLVILVGQSIVLGDVKTETLLHDEDPMNDQIIWQQYIQQVESLSPENRVSKFCREAGFMRVVETGIFPYIYHVGCTINLHSINNNGLVPGGQILSRRQTVFFLPVDPRDESHRDPEYVDFSAPRLARYLHSAWKRHQDAVFWVDIDLAIKEGLTFDQTRSNAIILQGTLPAHCILKVERLKTGEMLYE